jgi:chromosome segregation ATPase
MRIDALRLRHVRRFGDRGVAIEGLTPGLNVHCAPNESGKSTLLDALRTALFYGARSKDAHVRSLRPWSGQGDPYIEIDFVTEDGEKRLVKRFTEGRRGATTQLTAAGGELVAQEGDAENWLREFLSGDKAEQGPTGLFWMRQGETLAGTLGSQPKQADQQRQTMEGLLGHSVAEMDGGADTAAVLDALRGELARYETAKRKTPTGELLALMNEIEDLTARKAALEADTARGHTLRQDLQSQRDQLEALDNPDDRAARHQAIHEAEKSLRQHSEVAFRLGHTRQEIGKIEQRLAETDERREDLVRQSKRLETLTNQISMTRDDLTAIESDLSSLRGSIANTEDERSAARAEADGLREALSHWQRYRRNQQAAAERARLMETLEEARELEAQLKDAGRRAASARIDIEGLAGLERAVLTREAESRALAPVLTFERGSAASLDGRALQPGEARAVLSAGRLDVGDASFTLDVPGGREAARKLEEAQRALRRALAEAGVSTLEEAAAKEDARKIAAAEAKQLKASLTRVAPQGAGTVADALDTLEAVPEPLPEPAETEEALQKKLAEAAGRMAAAEDRLAALATDKAVLETRHTDLRISFESARREVSVIETNHGKADERRRSDELLAKEAEALRDELGALRRQREELEGKATELASAERILKRLHDAEEIDRRRRTELKEGIAAAKAELGVLYGNGADTALAEINGALEAANEKLSEIEARRAALRRLEEAILEEEAARRETVTKPVMAEISPMLTKLFGEAELAFDQAWKPDTLVRPGQPSKVESLSAGTKEQLAILTRLAFARLSAKRGEPWPVILDDALTYSDDTRLPRLFDILHEVSQETQVIVLTCHERLFRDLGGHRLTLQPFTERE